MPGGGSRPGERRGGRTRGTPNKATVARLEEVRVAEEVAAEIDADPVALRAAIQRAGARGFRGKDELIELGKVVKNHLVDFQAAALAAGKPGTKEYNAALWDKFKVWAEFFADVCNRVADFQDPRLKATMAMQLSSDAPKVINEGTEFVRTGDPVAAARAYQRFIQAPREVPALPPTTKKSP